MVDEINQGMDAVNERKIFDILVSSARNPATPQCFLLTPKLLPDMEYPDEENGKITIQSIFNGMKVPPSNQKQVQLCTSWVEDNFVFTTEENDSLEQFRGMQGLCKLKALPVVSHDMPERKFLLSIILGACL